MASCPRSDVVAKGEVALFHCWNRCVQRAFLCGVDPATGKDFSYRRDWIQQIERILAGLFAVEVAFHAEMVNHIHLIIRTRPDVVDTWSDEEVARRWLTITKLKRNGSDVAVEPAAGKLTAMLKDAEAIQEARSRLADVSWFMGTLDENISRRCNRDSGTSGTFWEQRFGCDALADEGAILVCGMYVDLNQIRAGEAQTPEDSRHTSAYERIEGLKQRKAAFLAGLSPDAPADQDWPDAWLCELTLQADLSVASAEGASAAPRCRASDKGLLPITLEKYLELLDWTGRQIRADKPGAIPDSLEPILDRIGIRQGKLVEAVESFCGKFGRVVGSAAAVAQAAQRVGRHWFRGKSQCAAAFG